MYSTCIEPEVICLCVCLLGSLEEVQMKVSLEDLLNADKQGTCLPCTCGDKPSCEGIT